MYLQDAYDQDPYRSQAPPPRTRWPRRSTTAPRTRRPPGAYQAQQPLYGQPPAAQYAPDPRVWAQPPAPEPEGPSQHLPYGDDPRTTQFVGVDDLVTPTGEQHQERDAFAHLFRDQQQGGSRPYAEPPAAPGAPTAPYPGQNAAGQYPGQAYAAPAPPTAGPYGSGPAPMTPGMPSAPAPAPEPAPAPAAKKGGRASGLLKSSAVMAAGTMVSRLTGFIRSALIVSALGLGLLGDSFQVAYQLPTMIYILTVGGGLNSVFVPQLVRAMKEDEDGGEAYANRLLTLVMVALGLLTALAMLGAPFWSASCPSPWPTTPPPTRSPSPSPATSCPRSSSWASMW